MKIAVIGWGSVGNAAILGLRPHHEVVGYDIDGRGFWEDVVHSEVAIVCVQTDATADEDLDMSNVFEVSSRLADDNFRGLVIIKSTLRPGTMEELEVLHPNIRFVYMPEFLREKDAVEWFANPDRIVASGHTTNVDVAFECFSWVPKETPRIRMKHLEAELGKLAHNAYIATKVTFTCEIERICHSKGANPIPVMETVWTDRRVSNPAHLTPGLGGFDGKCVPKDTSALATADKDPDSLLKILHSRGSKKEVNKREGYKQNHEEGGRTERSVYGFFILSGLLALLILSELFWTDWEEPIEPVHTIWEGGELPPPGSFIFFENVTSSDTHTRTYSTTTCKADYGSDGESCHTRTWDVTYLAVHIGDGWIYAEFEDFGLGVQECMLGSCDMLGILRDEGVFVVFDLR
jgi:UDPglucose 6-dehydrogenase